MTYKELVKTKNTLKKYVETFNENKASFFSSFVQPRIKKIKNLTKQLQLKETLMQKYDNKHTLQLEQKAQYKAIAKTQKWVLKEKCQTLGSQLIKELNKNTGYKWFMQVFSFNENVKLPNNKTTINTHYYATILHKKSGLFTLAMSDVKKALQVSYDYNHNRMFGGYIMDHIVIHKTVNNNNIKNEDINLLPQAINYNYKPKPIKSLNDIVYSTTLNMLDKKTNLLIKKSPLKQAPVVEHNINDDMYKDVVFN